MCERLESIRAVSAAADGLLLACMTQEQVKFDQTPPGISRALRRAYKTSLITPLDMIDQLRKLK